MANTKGGPHTQHLIEVKGGLVEDFTPIVETFKNDKGVHFVLAFSGGADDSSPLFRHVVESLKIDQGVVKTDVVDIDTLVSAAKREYVAGIVREVLLPLRGYRIAVLTGGTAWGVPSIATEVAKELGFPTIGVFPLAASLKKENMLPEEWLDLAVCVHPMMGSSQWGDEAAAYTKLLDAVIIIGGGAGTMVEVAHLLKQNEKRSAPTKHIIPIYGTGGTADKVSFFPGKPETMARCIPSHPIVTGTEACSYLKQAVFADDIYD
jgi:predicted Rossmann-fold nucleotide-binding protein